MTEASVVSFRIPRVRAARLRREAKHQGRTVAELLNELVEESFRHRDFPLIERRETVVGPLAYVRGSRLGVSWLSGQVRRSRLSIAAAAKLWDISPDRVRQAVAYAKAYPKEMARDAKLESDGRRWVMLNCDQNPEVAGGTPAGFPRRRRASPGPIASDSSRSDRPGHRRVKR